MASRMSYPPRASSISALPGLSFAICSLFAFVVLGALGSCAQPAVTECGNTGIFCPSGTHCAAIQGICISDTNTCGNGILDPGEVCDDGNTQDGDDCSHDCTSTLACGNGITDVNARIPEQCDDGANNGKIGDKCSVTCQLVKCGNGVVEQGEECDDGNLVDGDGCSRFCKKEVCGNGIIDPGEACDPPNPGTCSADCKSTLSCGNGTVDPGEECDVFGKDNDNNDCRSDCQFNRCGDGYVDMTVRPGETKPVEECDDAPPARTVVSATHSINDVIPTETATCNVDCTLPSCGDGKLNRHFKPDGTNPEQCDNGAANADTAACTLDCQFNVCGDGKVLAGVEACDDGVKNGTPGDDCSVTCQKVHCGNGIVEQGEECDDAGANNDNARCTSQCKFNVCGDGKTFTGVEQCDDGVGGVKTDTANCDSDCTKPVCGDGHLNTKANEVCDDGANNGKPGKPCSLSCQLVNCGNGVIEQGEECDDGNANSDTGRCTKACKLAFCGDGKTEAGIEQCDNGNANNDNATCTSTCQLNICGDGLPNNTMVNNKPVEECDDGANNGKPNDNCDSFCHKIACGNGIVDSAPPASEQCDPGIIVAGVVQDSTTCDSDCTAVVCGDGHVNSVAGEACDDGPLNGNPCDYNDENCKRCNSTCKGKVSPGGPFCGDAVVNGGLVNGVAFTETCDQGLANGTQCAYGDKTCLGGVNSTICNTNCDGFVANPNGTFCGDGHVQSQFNEQCDPGNPASPSLTPADTALCDSDCTFPICGDGHVNGAAGEHCDDNNTTSCGQCSADCSTQTLAAAATGTITVTDFTKITTGDTITLNDGFTTGGALVTFTVAPSGGGGGGGGTIAPDGLGGTIAITIAATGESNTTVAGRIATGIAGALDMTATANGQGVITLTNKHLSNLGNGAITITTVTAGALSSSAGGMTGGKAGDCLTGVGCTANGDCKSGTCTSGRCI